MTPGGDWVDVNTLTVAKATGVRAIHYRDANSLKNLPAEFTKTDADQSLAIASARMAAGGTLDVPAVLEAVELTDTSAVQAWIVERGTRFKLNAKELVQLADAGVPSSVTDVMIGVSFPEHFALREPRSSSVAVASGAGGVGGYDPGLGYGDCASALSTSLYGRNPCGPCDSRWSYGVMSPLTFDDCVARYGYGYARSLYDPYYPSPYSPLYGGYYGYGNYGYYSAPVVVVKGGDEPTHGRVVNGRGYTQGGSSTGASTGSARVYEPSRSASSSGSSSSGSSSGRTSSAGSSSTSSGSSSSSGSSGEVRTAHRRPPT
jgi:hypothetical protein